MHKINKYLLVGLSLVLVLLSGCQKETIPVSTQVTGFEEFVSSQFSETISDNYLTMHYSTMNPENYGVDRTLIAVDLGHEYSEDYIEETKQQIKQTKTKLAEFNYELLSESQKQTYDLIKYEIELSELGLDNKFQYIQSAFSPMSGIQSQFPTLFSDYVFYSEQDIKDMIILINDMPRYINEALEYTKKQKELGYMMSNQNIDDVLAYCQKIVDTQEESSILKALKNKIEQYPTFTNEQKQDYMNQVTQAFTLSFLPTYQTIIDTLSQLKSDSNNAQGLFHVENGKEYYEYLYQVQTSSNTPIPQMKEQLLQLAKTSLTTVQTIVTANPNLYDDYLEDTIKTTYSDFNTMLEDLKTWSTTYFPAIEPIDYTIDSLPEETTNQGVAAYYTISPIDNTLPDTIRVNMSGIQIEEISTFKTVAHEGYPGHMYQTNFIKQNLDIPYRQVTQCIGYTEGYATYVELESLNALNIDESLKALIKNLEVYQNCLIALLDIGIHYEGWDKEETQRYLEDYGLNIEATDSIYNQIQSNPGAFLAYYVGYAQIRQIKDNVQAQLGEHFSELQFNTVLLESGAVPFSIVKQNMDRYIQTNKLI